MGDIGPEGDVGSTGPAGQSGPPGPPGGPGQRVCSYNTALDMHKPSVACCVTHIIEG